MCFQEKYIDAIENLVQKWNSIFQAVYGGATLAISRKHFIDML